MFTDEAFSTTIGSDISLTTCVSDGWENKRGEASYCIHSDCNISYN